MSGPYARLYPRMSGAVRSLCRTHITTLTYALQGRCECLAIALLSPSSVRLCVPDVLRNVHAPLIAILNSTPLRYKRICGTHSQLRVAPFSDRPHSCRPRTCLRRS